MAQRFGEEPVIVGDQGTTVPPTTTYRPPEPGTDQSVRSGYADIQEGRQAAENVTIANQEAGVVTTVIPPPTVVPSPTVVPTPTATGNALPSLPSISNVGAVPFTGTVSNIPGGFQPLPQVAGGRKKLYQLSQFHGGINQKSSPRDIADFECQEAKNISFSDVGRIKLLGDVGNTNNGITVFEDDTMTGSDMGASGYGLFQFTAPADHDGGNIGSYVLTLTADGNTVHIHSAGEVTDGADNNWIIIGGTDNHGVAQVYYAAGNGVYVADAHFNNDNARGAKIWVSREDYNGAIVTKGWNASPWKALIESPHFIESSAGTIDAAANGKVTLEWDDGDAPELASDHDGAACVHIGSTGTGLWSGSYFFYISWIFDGGVETGLTSLVKTSGAFTPVFVNETLSFNFSTNNNDNDASPAISSTNYIGSDIRIEGARIYFKKVGDTERFLLAEVSLVDGVKGALDSTFTPWDENSEVYDLATNIVFDAPPEVYTYASLNGYYANEVYAKSGDTITDDTAGPLAKDVRYKTAVVGSGGIVFIGNVRFDGKHMPDSMMFSMPGKPGVFPQYNRFDSPSSDGSPIRALAAYRDTILQFKENGMYVINVSNPSQFYAQASFRDCGVFNPCQVFTTSFGVIFANKHGCYIYDGQKVTSLTDGKFNQQDWGLVEASTPDVDSASVPSVGYDPRSKSIIVLKNIGDDATDDDEDAWVYSMVTQSWTEGIGVVANGNDDRLSNFIITSGGYLTLKQEDEETLFNYNHAQTVDTGVQTITYWTKDLDFGLPSQTKYLYKVYITYKGDADSLTCAYGVDGETDANDLFHFSKVSWGGTTDTTPLADRDAGAGEDHEIWSVATLYPDDAGDGTDAGTEGKGWKSISLYFNGDVDRTFEIQDISILYRARPIK